MPDDLEMMMRYAKDEDVSSEYTETSEDEARKIGEEIGIKWDDVKFDPKDLAAGIGVEWEHGSKLGEDTNVTDDDPKLTAMIAWAHLKEDPDYYVALEWMEKNFDKQRTPALEDTEYRAGSRGRDAYMRLVEPGKKRDTSLSPELQQYVEKYVKSIKAATDKGMNANEAFKKIKPDMSQLSPDSLINLLWENQELGRLQVPANSYDLYTALEGILQQAIYQAAIQWWGRQRTEKAPEKQAPRQTNPEEKTVVERPRKTGQLAYRGARYRKL